MQHEHAHWAMRYGALDLMRCTEQTAILMSGAEGRGLEQHQVAQAGIMSMAGWIAGSPYVPSIGVYDEIYEGESGNSTVEFCRGIWDSLSHTPKASVGPDAGSLSTPLEFCLTPIDGKRALSAGRTGGTLSCLCFAPDGDGGEPSFRPPDRQKSPRRRGRQAEADQSPPYAVLCASRPFVELCKGRERLDDLVNRTTAESDGMVVEEFVDRLFHGIGESPGLPETHALAVLDEPQWSSSDWSRVSVPDRRKRVFTGSSIGLALATFFSRKGYDCSLSITRHQHLIPISIASRVLGGAVFAVPLRRSKESRELVVNAIAVSSESDFVSTSSAAMVVSGISEHVALSPVAFRNGEVEVNSLYLSSFTGSQRVLKHRLRLDGEHTAEFTAYGKELLDAFAPGARLPQPQTRPATSFITEYDQMFDRLKSEGKPL